MIFLVLESRNGDKNTNPRKYLKPAIVNGPRESSPILTMTNVDDQISVTSNALATAAHFDPSVDFGYFFWSESVMNPEEYLIKSHAGIYDNGARVWQVTS